MRSASPHLIGVDDGPFEKGQSTSVPLVAVMMECPNVVESVAVGAFVVDGEDASGHLARWIGSLRCHASVQALVLGGLTIAGLGIVDVHDLCTRLARPVLVVNRKNPSDSRLAEALVAAGLHDRLSILERAPRAVTMEGGLHLAFAGTTRREAERLVRLSLGKGQLPEPLRVAHLIARALVTGESRGRA